LGKDVPELRESPEKVAETILREARRAIEDDGAEVIVLGCTGYTALVEELMGQIGAPVLDAVCVSWKYAEMMGELYRKLGISHSKLYAYETPPPLERIEDEGRPT
jgi:allantoin racemase